MRRFKSIAGLLGALLPVLYCGGLVYYFVDNSGSIDDANTIGLGPTLLGLTIVGLLFCIPLLLKFVQVLAKPRAPRGPGDDGGTVADSKSQLDADAVIARYLAREPAAAGPVSTARLPANSGQSEARRFGQKKGN